MYAATGLKLVYFLLASIHSNQLTNLPFILAVAMFVSGKYKAAVNIWENICLVKYRELLGTHPFTASLLDYIGKGYLKLNDPEKAVAFKKESLKMRLYLLGNWYMKLRFFL